MNNVERRSVDAAIEIGAKDGTPWFDEGNGDYHREIGCGKVCLREWVSITTRVRWRSIDWKNGKVKSSKSWFYSSPEKPTDFDELAKEISELI